MQSLKDIKSVLKEKKLSDEYASNIENQFSGLPKEILKNVLQTTKHKLTGIRYKNEIKQFASTLSFYSLKAYHFKCNTYITSSINNEQSLLTHHLVPCLKFFKI